jgi:exodeoxyribonuclease V alpha subunit
VITGVESVEVDVADARLALRATGALAEFNRAGVLTAADVHVAMRLGALATVDDEAVLLAAALAVRAPRLAHVCVDLTTVRSTATSDLDEPVDVQALPWPDTPGWAGRLAASPLVAVGDEAGADRPLRLDGDLLYLDRYWRDERSIADDLRDRAARPPADLDDSLLAAGLDRLFGDDHDDLQRAAARAAVEHRFAVVAGGPGTGKTTTVARILALLAEQAVAAGLRMPRVALAAPTGKAAARLEESVRHEAAAMDVDAAVRTRLQAASASTLHRLLGWRPDSRSRFRHDRRNRLPHDVVIVDETSMVSLSLMARLVAAVRDDARLVLVGDPDQLASVEAGAVLGDIVGPTAITDEPAASPVGDGIVVLRRGHRFADRIAEVARAIQAGDGGATLSALTRGGDEVRLIATDVAEAADDSLLRPVRVRVVDAARDIVEAASAGDAAAALQGLRAMRVLCAHRRGPYGVAEWTARIERWLAAAIPDYGEAGEWYVGRPLLVTENDHTLRLYNGDTGVVVSSADGTPMAAFDRGGDPFTVGPRRLSAVDTVHAMTIHKSQGSQFDAVAVILPDAASPILTRELLYTAVTRAQTEVTLVGTEESIRAAVARPITRASGLRRRLWT